LDKLPKQLVTYIWLLALVHQLQGHSKWSAVAP
jgi:hypothetical protein